MQNQIETTPGGQTAAFSERRGTERRRVLKGATLSFNNGYAAFDCIVKNLSEAGASCFGRNLGAAEPIFAAIVGREKPSASDSAMAHNDDAWYLLDRIRLLRP